MTAQAAPLTVQPRLAGIKRQRELIFKIVSYLVLIAFAAAILMPFAFMLSTAFKTQRGLFVLPPQWIPDPITFENFEKVLTPTKQANIPRAFVNSLFIAIVTTIGEVFVSTLAGFAFARMRFPGRNKFFALLLATMMIPGVVTLVPSFILFKELGWLRSFLPLIVPVMFGTAFAVFLSRQFFATLPQELEEAGKIDGANMFQVYIYIFLPLATPIIATLFVLGFIARWNDFLSPLIYLIGAPPEMDTIPLALARLQGAYTVEWTTLMAGSTVALVPIILLFFMFQRYFIESIAMTGVKG